ncbi:hypothetical protein BMETH_2681_1 [methanotrophic bacterial endosymbiont of Bathymodiolus sp.]|nr:hypothetical protein BMETH_2681_1 [methanotrophic bacterial endosymbiont of Bathymodiolus sp.]
MTRFLVIEAGSPGNICTYKVVGQEVYCNLLLNHLCCFAT